MKLFATILSFLLLAGTVLVLSQRQPSYNGKSLGRWLDDFSFPGEPNGPNYLAADHAACEAVRAIGTNALPCLVAMLRAKDSRFKLVVFKLLQKQSVIPIRHERSEVRRYRVARAFGALGNDAHSAFPELVRLLNDPEDDVDEYARMALTYIGPSGVAPLAEALEHGSTRAKAVAARGLGELRQASLSAVPALLRGAQDNSTEVRRWCSDALGQIQESHSP